MARARDRAAVFDEAVTPTDESDPESVRASDTPTAPQPLLASPGPSPIHAASEGMLHSLQRYANFRLLFFGTIATNSAFWMYQIAVGWLALQQTDSPLFVGLTGFAGGIPILFLALPSGVIIDRVDRRRVLAAAQIAVMVISTLFAIMVGFGLIRPWSILLLAFLYGCAMSFVFPTRNAMVPSFVERIHLPNAVALNAAGQNATRVVGPSLAGVLIAAIGVAGTFAVAAAMQILALIWTARMPAVEQVTRQTGRLLESFTLGLRVVAKDQFFSGVILLATVSTVLIMPYLNLMPVFAQDEMHLGPQGLGALMAISGIGSVVGALTVARFRNLPEMPGIQPVTAGAFALAVIGFALSPWIILTGALLLVAGVVSAAFMAINQTALQLRVDDDVRGRVLSIYLLTWGMLPLGQLPIGALADQIGAPLATALAGSIALVLMAVIAVRFRSLRT